MFEEDIFVFYKKGVKNASLNFKLRLFLSLDFSNSTNYKQSIPPQLSPQSSYAGADLSESDRPIINGMLSATSPWITPFSYFISQIDRVIDLAWKQVVGSLNSSEPETQPNPSLLLRPKYWKPIGDEVVYQVRLVHPLQVALCLYCWKIVTREVRKQVINSRPLNVKAAAWLAGFPINNSEFVVGVTSDDWSFLDQQKGFPTSNYKTDIIHHILPILCRLDQKFFNRCIKNLSNLSANDVKNYKNIARRLQYKQIDFLGPQMDTGFRIADKSTPKKMMISADVAYILSTLLAGEVKKSSEEVNSNRNGEIPKKEAPANDAESSMTKNSVEVADKDSNENLEEQNIIERNTISFCKNIYSHLESDLKKVKTRTLETMNITFKSKIGEIISEKLELYYDGRFPLKGVREGRPYPLFWLNADEENAIDIAENKLSEDKSVTYEDVNDFTFRFLAQNYLGYNEKHPTEPKELPSSDSFVGDEWLMVPFIQGLNLIPYRFKRAAKKENLTCIISAMHNAHKEKRQKIFQGLSTSHVLSLLSSASSSMPTENLPQKAKLAAHVNRLK